MDAIGPLAPLDELDAVEQLRTNRFENVRTVLVMLSAQGMVYDIEALRQKILMTYRDAAIFFVGTAGKRIGVQSPQKVDLLIDFTGSGQRQGFFAARRLRAMARCAVGRNAGFFRRRIYDRVVDEKVDERKDEKADEMPSALKRLNPWHSREELIQKQVLALAGVPMIAASDVTPDRGKIIALELPPLR